MYNQVDIIRHEKQRMYINYTLKELADKNRITCYRKSQDLRLL